MKPRPLTRKGMTTWRTTTWTSRKPSLFPPQIRTLTGPGLAANDVRATRQATYAVWGRRTNIDETEYNASAMLSEDLNPSYLQSAPRTQPSEVNSWGCCITQLSGDP